MTGNGSMYWNRKIQIHLLVLRRESLNILRTFRPRSHVSDLTQILAQFLTNICVTSDNNPHPMHVNDVSAFTCNGKFPRGSLAPLNDNRKNPPADPRHRKLQIRGTFIWGSGLQWKFTFDFKTTCEHTLTQPYKFCPSKATHRGVYRFIQLPLNSMLNLSSVRAP